MTKKDSTFIPFSEAPQENHQKIFREYKEILNIEINQIVNSFEGRPEEVYKDISSETTLPTQKKLLELLPFPERNRIDIIYSTLKKLLHYRIILNQVESCILTKDEAKGAEEKALFNTIKNLIETFSPIAQNLKDFLEKNEKLGRLYIDKVYDRLYLVPNDPSISPKKSQVNFPEQPQRKSCCLII